MNLLVAVVLIVLGIAFSAVAQTNRFFITDESKSHYREEVGRFTPEQIARAQQAKDSRPADQDPEGNWGPVTEGFQLSIRFQKNTFTNEEPITAGVIMRNLTDGMLTIPCNYYGARPDTRFVLFRGKDPVYGKYDIRPGATFAERLGASRVGTGVGWPSPPGTQRKWLIDLRRLYDLKDGRYVIIADRDLLALDNSRGTNILSGKAEFSISSTGKVQN